MASCLPSGALRVIGGFVSSADRGYLGIFARLNFGRIGQTENIDDDVYPPSLIPCYREGAHTPSPKNPIGRANIISALSRLFCNHFDKHFKNLRPLRRQNPRASRK